MADVENQDKDAGTSFMFCVLAACNPELYVLLLVMGLAVLPGTGGASQTSWAPVRRW